MPTAELAGVAGESTQEFSKAAQFGHGGDVAIRVIEGVKRHPFGAIVAGLAIGLAALALNDRLTRKV
ncbi:MAG: hypothetical protein ACRD3E_18630 [Terriglobales bacterium]